MTIKQRVLQIIIVSILMPAAAFSFDPAGFKPHTQEQFSEYWYSGRGEISRFTLEQARYDEIHAGGPDPYPGDRLLAAPRKPGP